jgi:WD40 repeat protein
MDVMVFRSADNIVVFEESATATVLSAVMENVYLEVLGSLTMDSEAICQSYSVNTIADVAIMPSSNPDAREMFEIWFTLLDQPVWLSEISISVVEQDFVPSNTHRYWRVSNAEAIPVRPEVRVTFYADEAQTQPLVPSGGVTSAVVDEKSNCPWVSISGRAAHRSGTETVLSATSVNGCLASYTTLDPNTANVISSRLADDGSVVCLASEALSPVMFVDDAEGFQSMYYTCQDNVNSLASSDVDVTYIPTCASCDAFEISLVADFGVATTVASVHAPNLGVGSFTRFEQLYPNLTVFGMKEASFSPDGSKLAFLAPAEYGNWSSLSSTAGSMTSSTYTPSSLPSRNRSTVLMDVVIISVCELQDDPNFIDTSGNPCNWWHDQPCEEVALNTNVSVANLLDACPISCGTCAAFGTELRREHARWRSYTRQTCSGFELGSTDTTTVLECQRFCAGAAFAEFYDSSTSSTCKCFANCPYDSSTANTLDFGNVVSRTTNPSAVSWLDDNTVSVSSQGAPSLAMLDVSDSAADSELYVEMIPDVTVLTIEELDGSTSNPQISVKEIKFYDETGALLIKDLDFSCPDNNAEPCFDGDLDTSCTVPALILTFTTPRNISRASIWLIDDLKITVDRPGFAAQQVIVGEHDFSQVAPEAGSGRVELDCWILDLPPPNFSVITASPFLTIVNPDEFQVVLESTVLFSFSLLQTVALDLGVVAYSLDGSFVAFTQYNLAETFGDVRVISCDDWTITATVDVAKAPIGLAWSGDGNTLAVSFHDGSVDLLDVVSSIINVETSTAAYVVATLNASTFPVTSLSWHASRNHLATYASGDDFIRFWDAHGALLSTLRIDSNDASVVLFTDTIWVVSNSSISFFNTLPQEWSGGVELEYSDDGVEWHFSGGHIADSNNAMPQKENVLVRVPISQLALNTNLDSQTLSVDVYPTECNSSAPHSSNQHNCMTLGLAYNLYVHAFSADDVGEDSLPVPFVFAYFPSQPANVSAAILTDTSQDE